MTTTVLVAQSRDFTMGIVATGTVEAEAADYARIIAESIEVALDRRGYTRGGPGSDGATEYLVVEYAVHAVLPRLHVSIVVRDPSRSLRVAGVAVRARANLTLIETVEDLMSELDPAIEAYLRLSTGERDALAPVPLLPSVAFGGFGQTAGDPDEASRVPERIFVDTGAELLELPSPTTVTADQYEFAQGSEITIRGERPGFFPESEPIGLGPDQTPVEPESLDRASVHGLQVHYSWARLIGLGAGFRYYLLPGRLYGSSELDLYTSGAPGMTPYTVLHLEPRLLVGLTVLGNPQSRFRAVLSSGFGYVGTFFLNGNGIPPYHDFYFNVFNLGVETQVRRTLWFIRSGMIYAFDTEGRGFFKEGMETGNLNPLLSVGGVYLW